jgi:hypothetical protein
MFVNCETRLTGPDETKNEITDSIPALFYPLKQQNGSGEFSKNIVFANQKEKYLELVNDLISKINQGLPPIHVNRYKVTKQPHYNITDEYEVEIMWIYNAPVKEWENSLKPEITDLLKNSKLLENFPYFKTFMENPPEILALKPPQVNLLSHLTAWIVDSNKDLIVDFLNKKKTIA